MGILDAIVIGAGIIGSTVAKALRKNGLDVLLLDDRRPMRGTAPSGGHLKPSWFGDMKKEDYIPAMDLLDELWGLVKEEFVVYPFKVKTEVYRVDTDIVNAVEFTRGKVVNIYHLNNYPIVELDDGREEQCRLLVVAAGVWCDQFFPEIKIQCKQGVSFRVKGELDTPFIRPWAPFKQVVAHQQTNREIWVGDGSAILADNWDDEQTNNCINRCSEALSLPTSNFTRTMHGYRPYCKTGADPCLLKQVSKRCWVATGAGKSGTIAAGWVANMVMAKVV